MCTKTRMHTHTRRLELCAFPRVHCTFREQTATAKMPQNVVENLEQAWVKKPRKPQFYIIFFFNTDIIHLPCTLNYGCWLMILLFFMHIFQGLSAINCMYRILCAYTMDTHLKPSAANSDVMHAFRTQHCSSGSWWRTHRPIPYAWTQKAPSDWEGGPHPWLRPGFIFWSQAGHILWDLNWPDRTSGLFSGAKSQRRTPRGSEI